MIKKIFFGLLSLMVFANNALAQEIVKVENPSVVTEGLVGSRGFSFQFVSDKKFQSIPKLGYYFVSNFQTDWGETQISDYMLQGHLTYALAQNLNVEAGFFWNPVDGIRPSAGLIYTYAKEDWFVLANPRMDVYKNPNAEIFGFVEYKPRINDKLKLFTKFQGLYCHTLGLDVHSKSYMMFRLGLTTREFTFGVGSNSDFYGADKINKNNIGAFILFYL